jgi:type I restriction enzyme R subunit
LDYIIRSIVGMNQEAVRDRFAEFANHHSKLTAKQILFLNLLQNHIATYGAIELDRLYEAPFTTVHSEGLDGVFTDEEQIDELLTIIQTFKPKAARETANA